MESSKKTTVSFDPRPSFCIGWFGLLGGMLKTGDFLFWEVLKKNEGFAGQHVQNWGFSILGSTNKSGILQEGTTQGYQ